MSGLQRYLHVEIELLLLFNQSDHIVFLFISPLDNVSSGAPQSPSSSSAVQAGGCMDHTSIATTVCLI